ncbi:MAG: methyltransferase domain-containing protein [Chloroflexi bacterium]|nr:methyltransferase domain-containing protein [Chloroflexota bacterium]
MSDNQSPHRFPPEMKEALESPERYRELQPDRLLKKLGLKAGQKVVDVGCGTGFFTVSAARLAGQDGHVWAVDTEPDMLAAVKDKITKEGLVNVTLVRAEAPATGLPGGVADVVLFANVLHEMDDRVKLLQEGERLLRKDGRIFVIEFDKKEHPGPGPLKGYGPPLGIRIAKEELPDLAGQAGLSVVKIVNVPPVSYAAVLMGQGTRDRD